MMTAEAAVAVVRSYYGAYQGENPDAVTSALRTLLDETFVLDSPLVQEQLGGPATGPAAFAAAAGAASFLRHVTVESLHGAADGSGAAALIHFPSPAGTVVQSEHFDINTDTGRITRLRSYYDPRKLLQLRAGAPN